MATWKKLVIASGSSAQYIKGDGTLGTYSTTDSSKLPLTGGTISGSLNIFASGGDANLRLRSGATRSGLFIDKPATTTVMGSALVLADSTFRLGTASYYHMEMTQAGNTILKGGGNTALTINTSQNATFTSNLTVNGGLYAAGAIYADENIYHNGDTDNKIRFETNKITLSNTVGTTVSTPTSGGISSLYVTAIHPGNTDVYKIGGMQAQIPTSAWLSANVKLLGPALTGYGTGVEYLKFDTDGTNKRATFAGKVAISSAFTASELLGVKGSVGSDWGARIENTSSTGAGALIKSATTNAGVQLFQVRSGSENAFTIMGDKKATFASSVTSNGSIIRRANALTNNGIAMLTTDSNHGAIRLYNSTGTLKTQLSSGTNSYILESSLGIGTNSPSAPMEIYSTNDEHLRINNPDGGWNYINFNHGSTTEGFIGTNGNEEVILGSTPNNPIVFMVQNAERARITNTGIGIGNTSPASALTIDVADGQNKKALHITQNDAGEWTSKMDTSGYGLLVRSTANDTTPVIQVQGNGTSNNILYCLANGQVGINTNDPSRGQSTPISDVKLGVLGNQMFSNLSTTNTDQSKLFFFRSDGAVASQGAVPSGLKMGAIEWDALTSGDNNNSIASARIETVASNTWSSASVRNAHITFSTIGANTLNERMRLTSTGLAIGTIPTHNLNVYNGSGASSMTVGKYASGKTVGVIGTSADTSGYLQIQSYASQGSTFGNIVLNAQGGNVSIGTTGFTGGSRDTDAKLDVMGGINVEAYKKINFDGNGYSVHGFHRLNSINPDGSGAVPMLYSFAYYGHRVQNQAGAIVDFGYKNTSTRTLFYGDLETNGDLIVNAKQIRGGFGAETTSGTADWNHATNARSGNGYSLLLGSATNGPTGSQYYHTLGFEYGVKNGTGNLTQIGIPYTGAGIVFRSRYSGSWSAYKKVLDNETYSDYVVPKTGGTFTGNVNMTADKFLNVGGAVSKNSNIGSTAHGITIQDANAPTLSLWDTTNAGYHSHFYQVEGNSGIRSSGSLTISTNAGTTALTIDSSQNATFSGDIVPVTNNGGGTLGTSSKAWSGIWTTGISTSGNITVGNAVVFNAGNNLSNSGGVIRSTGDFEVLKGSPLIRVKDSTNSVRGFMSVSSGVVKMGGSDNNNVEIHSNGTARLTIASGGGATFFSSATIRGVVTTGNKILIGHGGVTSTGSYDKMEIEYTGYNSGSPRLYITPDTNPGSGVLYSYVHIRSKASGVGANKMGLIVDGQQVIGNTTPYYNLDIVSEGVATGLRLHRKNSSNNTTTPIGIGFSHRGDGANSSGSDTRAGIYSHYNGEIYIANRAATSIGTSPYQYRTLLINGSGTSTFINSAGTTVELATSSNGAYAIRSASPAKFNDYYFNGTSGSIKKNTGDNFLSFASDLSATFTGNVRLPNSGKLYLWNDHSSNYLSYNKWQASVSTGMTIANTSGSGSLILKSGNSTALTLDSSQDATFAGDLDASSGQSLTGWHTQDKIWVMPSDFMPSTGRNEYNIAMVDNGGEAKTMHGAVSGYVNIPIPSGYKVTHYRLNGTASVEIKAYYSDCTTATATSVMPAPRYTNTEYATNPSSGIEANDTTGRYMILRWKCTSTSHRLYGGYIKIAKI